MTTLCFSLSLIFSLNCNLLAKEPVATDLLPAGFADPELPEEEYYTEPSEVQLVRNERLVDDESPADITREPTRTARSIVRQQPALKSLDAVEAGEEVPATNAPKARVDALAPGDLDYEEAYADESYNGDVYGTDYFHESYEDGSCGAGGCNDGCCGAGLGCGMFGARRGGPWFADLDYLQWWTQGMDVPPLVVAVNGTSADVIFGNQKMLTDNRPGYRIRLGKWFDECKTVGIQGEFLQLNSIGQTYLASSNALGVPQLGRPFIEANSGQQFIEDVSIPGQLAGSVLVEARGQFTSAGLRMLHNLCNQDLGCGNHRRIDFLWGYRYMQLDESLLIHEDLVSILPAPNQGSFLIDDRFQTYNDFNGGEFGWMWQRGVGRWNVNTITKLAVGSTHQTVRISGQTITSGAQVAADNGTRPGGLLTQTTNIGTYSRNKFTLAPEFNVNLGYQITSNLRVQVGYSLLYWSQVVRPGDQVDLTVNQNLIPSRSFPLQNPNFTGPARPAFTFKDTDFWAQGINVGVHLEY